MHFDYMLIRFICCNGVMITITSPSVYYQNLLTCQNAFKLNTNQCHLNVALVYISINKFVNKSVYISMNLCYVQNYTFAWIQHCKLNYKNDQFNFTKNIYYRYYNRFLPICCYFLRCTDKCVPFPNMILLALLVTQ